MRFNEIDKPGIAALFVTLVVTERTGGPIHTMPVEIDAKTASCTRKLASIRVDGVDLNQFGIKRARTLA
ncbi:MAG: hypothetical protein R2845_09725 [Thermomicrobiales bacterium]